MLWVVEMQSGGVFEAESKRKLTEQMIEFYGSRDRQAEQIKAIYIVKKNDTTDEFCKYVVNKIQEIVDEGVFEYRKNYKEACDEQKDIESDYLRAIL